MAIRGTIARLELREVIAATYHQVWWPSTNVVRFGGDQLLTEAYRGRYRDVVPMLALAGLRWGELAGLQVGDRVSVPGPGLRLRRAVLAGGGGGALYEDTLKNNRARTVPLVVDLVPIVDRWSDRKTPDAWCSDTPRQR